MRVPEAKEKCILTEPRICEHARFDALSLRVSVVSCRDAREEPTFVLICGEIVQGTAAAQEMAASHETEDVNDHTVAASTKVWIFVPRL